MAKLNKELEEQKALLEDVGKEMAQLDKALKEKDEERLKALEEARKDKDEEVNLLKSEFNKRLHREGMKTCYQCLQATKSGLLARDPEYPWHDIELFDVVPDLDKSPSEESILPRLAEAIPPPSESQEGDPLSSC
ncbi:hypothetical protein CDL15_Pgr016346 [Punica granatum]|nr:hypothetical protein CDL15_Pgr016346 [Punica granatum]